MDLKVYFRKIREIESALGEDFPVVVSLETSDGGKAGVVSEVSRANAARLIAEGRAVLATEQQKQEFIARQLESRKAIERDEMVKRIQVAIVTDPETEDRTSTPKRSAR